MCWFPTNPTLQTEEENFETKRLLLSWQISPTTKNELCRSFSARVSRHGEDEEECWYTGLHTFISGAETSVSHRTRWDGRSQINIQINPRSPPGGPRTPTLTAAGVE